MVELEHWRYGLMYVRHIYTCLLAKAMYNKDWAKRLTWTKHRFRRIFTELRKDYHGAELNDEMGKVVGNVLDWRNFCHHHNVITYPEFLQQCLFRKKLRLFESLL